LSLLGQREQALIGNAAPEEERQARSHFDVTQAICSLVLTADPMHAQEEVRHEHSFERELIPASKFPPSCRAVSKNSTSVRQSRFVNGRD